MADGNFAGQPLTLNIKFKPHKAPMLVHPSQNFFVNISNRINNCSGQTIDPQLLYNRRRRKPHPSSLLVDFRC